jgi:hypothetical protein
MMGLTTAQFTLGSQTAKKIVSKDTNPQRCIIHSHEHGNNPEIFVGPLGVTASTGLHIPNGQNIDIVLNPNDELYAIAGSGSPVVHVMVQEF